MIKRSRTGGPWRAGSPSVRRRPFGQLLPHFRSLVEERDVGSARVTDVVVVGAVVVVVGVVVVVSVRVIDADDCLSPSVLLDQSRYFPADISSGPTDVSSLRNTFCIYPLR